MANRNEGFGRIVDVHCHILPGLDDGAESPSVSLDMMREAAGSGITDIVVTPHFNNRRGAPPQTVYRVMTAAQEAADKHGISLRFYPGNEFYYFEDLPQYLKERRAFTMNGSDFVLIEFSPIAPFHVIENAMDSVMFAGFHPVIAHIERYESLIKDFEKVYRLSDLGVRIQVNASSVTGGNGKSVKKFVHGLLQEELVDFIGTDAHGNKHRTPEISKCRDILIKKYGFEYASLLLRDNAVEMFCLN